MKKTKTNRLFIYLLIVIAGMLIVLAGNKTRQHFSPQTPAPMLLSGSMMPAPRTLTSFTLTDSKGVKFTNSNLNGRWSFLFFGFTHCPSLCPTTLATLNQVEQKLIKEKQKVLPQVVFISVDPERDTLEKIGQYVTAFNPSFIGATGAPDQLQLLAKQLDVVYTKMQRPGGDYMINHTGSILVMNPEGQLYAVFTMPHNADNIAKDFPKIVQSYK